MADAAKYRALVGLNTPLGRFEVGEVVRGVAPKTIPELVRQGALVEVGSEADPGPAGAAEAVLRGQEGSSEEPGEEV